MDARLDRLEFLTKPLPGEVQVVRLLQIEPQAEAGAEPAAQMWLRVLEDGSFWTPHGPLAEDAIDVAAATR